MRTASAGLLLACLLVSPVARAQADDWWGRDKVQHFAASALIAGGGYAIGAAVSDDRLTRATAGAGLALLAGAGKETLDWVGAGDASLRDFTWDVAGCATGVAVAWLIDRLLGARHTPSASDRRADVRPARTTAARVLFRATRLWGTLHGLPRSDGALMEDPRWR